MVQVQSRLRKDAGVLRLDMEWKESCRMDCVVRLAEIIWLRILRQVITGKVYIKVYAPLQISLLKMRMLLWLH